MRLERDLPPDDRVQPPASPRSVYPLLAQCFEDGLSAFDSWYVDVSHRLRHGCCHMVVLSDAQGPAATAMTVAECHGAALLGAVATRPDCRSRGYASACVSTLAHTMLAKGKAVWICPKIRRHSVCTSACILPSAAIGALFLRNNCFERLNNRE